MTDAFLRFLAGGCLVSVFAVIGQIVEPKGFAGLFGAAPSVALASLTLVLFTKGRDVAAVECRSMLLGAIALGIFCVTTVRLLVRTRLGPLASSGLALTLWLAVAFGGWWALLR